MNTELKKWIIATALAVWGFATFFMMCGEDNGEMSNTRFVLIKLLAIASFLALVKVAQIADKKHLLP